MKRDVFRDEEGFSAAGTAVALLVAVSLVFAAGKTYRVSSASAEIQEVADAAALAAENVVAEYMLAVRLCDAVTLSLSLTAVTACGIGVAALCVPPAAGAATKLIDAGMRLFEARDSFAERASEGLEKLQRALPYMAAANAAAVARANGDGASGANYLAFAVLVPGTGVDAGIGSLQGTEDIRQAFDEHADALQEAASQAEEAAQRAAEAKERAFARDCGDNPAYCLYERADHLAGLPAAQNPLYASVDAWSFSVPLERAKAYYERRLAVEAPSSGSVSERANSALRRVFYEYAAEEVGKGYVREDAESFDALFPHLPRNTAEMRATSLYSQAIYPVTVDAEGSSTLHAWPGCPEAAGAGGRASVADMEAGGWPACDQCEFTASSLGKVAAASTAIENGFEYHYEAIADAAEEYEAARREMAPCADEVRERAGGIFDALEKALDSVAGQRIDAAPPGRMGAVALVVGSGSGSGPSWFDSMFAGNGGTLGTRAAVSASTLLAEQSEEGRTVVSSLLDGIADRGGAVTGVLQGVLDCWSAMLRAYSDGQQAVTDAVRNAGDAVPLSSASGLGSWAADAFGAIMEGLGLQPAKLDALKPVLVNSGHVARADDGAFGVRFMRVKQQALDASGSSPSLFSSLVSDVEKGALDALDRAEGGVEVAVIELPFGWGEFPLVLALPPSIVDAAGGLVERVAEGVRAAAATVTGVRPWE